MILESFNKDKVFVKKKQIYRHLIISRTFPNPIGYLKYVSKKTIK